VKSISPTVFMIVLNFLMIAYTTWILHQGSSTKPIAFRCGIALLAWLGLLHLGISNQALFPSNISGIAFLLVIFGAVGVVGVLLLGARTLRTAFLGMQQKDLMLFQGIRVFYGAGFLSQAATGVLPLDFGIIDGFTHIGAGFFGLVAAYSVATNADPKRRLWFANAFGLADILIVASTLALLLLPTIGPHHSMMYAVFLPAALWLWAHLISIGKLMSGEKLAPRELAA
jgi:hypothetical protein